MTIKSPLPIEEVLDTLLKTEYIQKYLMHLDSCDPETRAHSVRVAQLATDMGIEEGLDYRALKTLCLAALLHDIGKVDVDQELLHAPRKLTQEEKKVVDRHTIHGARKIQGRRFKKVREIVRRHHDYQKGKKVTSEMREKGSIAHLTEIVAAADVFDALCSVRPYKEALAKREVAHIMVSEFTGSSTLILLALKRY